MADLLTMQEHKGQLGGLKLAYIGDGNNVARSLCLSSAPLGIDFTVAAPPGYHLDGASLDLARDLARRGANGASSEVVALIDPEQAVQGADVVYTDVWTSMGEEEEAETRRQAFQGYTVDPDMMARANPGAIFMHDMPVHYGEEVPPGMLDHPQSVAYQQAHNRLHAQKALLEFLLGAE